MDFVDLMQAYVLWISMFRHVDFVQAEVLWTTTLKRLYEIHMPKHRNPQHIGMHEIHEIHKLLW